MLLDIPSAPATPTGHINEAPRRRNVLIFDINNEYDEYLIPTIMFEHVPVLMMHPKPQIRRIAPFKYTGKGAQKMNTNEMLEMLGKIVDIYQGGCLVIEDPSKFFSKSVSEDLIGAICTNRHNSCDMVLHYQSVGRILPVLHENINLYRFHHQSDDVKRSQKKLEDLTEVFKISQIMVDNQFYGRFNGKPNKYYHVYIDKDLGKIMGNYTKEDFDKAVDHYISYNQNELKPWSGQRDENGKKLYTMPQAIAEYKKVLTEKYYGLNVVIDENQEREAKMIAAIGFKGTGKTRESIRELLFEYCPGALTPAQMAIFKK